MYQIKDPWQSRIINIPFKQRAWFTSRDSLTQRIQNRCKKFRVEKISQKFAKINYDEMAVLNISSRLVHVREVYLYCAENPVIYARTTLARNSLRSDWRYLTKMGNRPLGAALFSNPRIRRQSLHFRRINRYHPLYAMAVKKLQNPPSSLWARRSIFMLDRLPILVTEVFLTGVFLLDNELG